MEKDYDNEDNLKDHRYGKDKGQSENPKGEHKDKEWKLRNRWANQRKKKERRETKERDATGSTIKWSYNLVNKWKCKVNK